MIIIINWVLLLLSIVIAVIGYKKKVIDKYSLLFVLFFSIYFIFLFPIYFFISLLILYIVTSIATKYKLKTKKVCHKKGRTVSNLLSNLLIPIIFSVIYLIFGNNLVFYFVFLASLSCACSDTLASEVGQLSKKNPRLITTFEEVKTGTEGGVSILGLIFALIGGILVALPSLYYFGFLNYLIIVLVGFIGCNIDSFIGAYFELKGKCTNETTNLIATLSAGILGLLVFVFLV
jgi:uncharacterized protein (TIGR00297 family)